LALFIIVGLAGVDHDSKELHHALEAFGVNRLSNIETVHGSTAGSRIRGAVAMGFSALAMVINVIALAMIYNDNKNTPVVSEKGLFNTLMLAVASASASNLFGFIMLNLLIARIAAMLAEKHRLESMGLVDSRLPLLDAPIAPAASATEGGAHVFHRREGTPVASEAAAATTAAAERD
jgi:hypothetical protein